MKKAEIDIMQIEEERRNTLELIIVVLLLGLVLNIIASAVYNYFQVQNWEGYLLLGAVVVGIFVLGIYIFFGLIRPAELCVEIPVVLFYDTEANTISVPTWIHYPPSKSTDIGIGFESLVPFPILSRLYFDKYKKLVETEQPNLADVSVQQGILAFLLQFVLFDHYTKTHSNNWAPMHRVSIGPFCGSGYGRDLPKQTYSREEMVLRSKNKFFEIYDRGMPLNLPIGSTVEFSSPYSFSFRNSLYHAKIEVRAQATQDLSVWGFALGTTSSWHRELSNGFSKTYAHLFNVRIEVSLEVGIQRFFAENWLSARFRPKIALRDICEWINAWISSVQDFFDWVDEDIDSVPADERALLINEASLTYRSQVEGAPLIHFGGM